MLFNSFTFLVFFLTVLWISRRPQSWNVKKGFLLLMSYLFYACWNPPFVVLLWISTVGDWYFAKGISAAGKAGMRKLFLAASLALNLGLLGYYKYALFFVDSLVRLLGACSIEWNPARPDIILPVGISFYTFQTLSYTLDVYRGMLKPDRSFLDYALYVTFFPQLVAGPIVRARDFLPQCAEPKQASASQLGWGASLMVLGLFSKVVISDTLMAPIVEQVFQGGHVDFFHAWAGVFGFAIQILCDFSGYSSCAIGAAMCFGFVLPDNFRFPYGAVGFSDFWRRWHISLSTWLKDYLYISLGGSRRGTFQTYRNLMLTMLLGGLWHGASWMFVIWGGLHGGYLVLERLLKKAFSGWTFWGSRAGQAALGALTFLGVCFAWIFFRADNVDTAKRVLSGMTGYSGLGRCDAKLGLIFAVTLIFVIGQGAFRNRSLEEIAEGMPPIFRYAAVLLMMAGTFVILSSGQSDAFLYFQF